MKQQDKFNQEVYNNIYIINNNLNNISNTLKNTCNTINNFLIYYLII